MLDSLDTAARRAVSRARWHATRLSHVDVGTLHLLLGVVEHLAEHDAERVLDIDLERLRAQVALRAGSSETSVVDGRRGFTLEFGSVIERAVSMAAAGGESLADPLHLLTAILDEANEDGGGVECAILAAGGEPSRLRPAHTSVVLEPLSPRADLELEFHPDLEPTQIATAIGALGDLFRAFGGAGFEVRLEARECECLAPEVSS